MPSANSDVFLCRGEPPDKNIRKLMKMLGGVESVFGKDDIVVIKPNSQWWLQGMTNTDSIVALIEMILALPGFSGEIIIADNHQFQEDNSRGWTTTTPNGRLI